MNARQEFNLLLEKSREAVYASVVGFGEFLAESAVLEQANVIAALLAFQNREPKADVRLRDLIDDAIEQYSQQRAEAAEFYTRPISTKRSRAEENRELIATMMAQPFGAPALCFRQPSALGAPPVVVSAPSCGNAGNENSNAGNAPARK